MHEFMARVLHEAAVLLPPFFVGVLLVIGAIAIATWIMRLMRRRPGFATTREPKNDLTNTMIMFQTMRDILEQQKDVARQLNVNLDKKIKYIRGMVETALGDLNEMREAARRLAVELSEAKAELAALQAKLAQSEGELPLDAHPEDAPVQSLSPEEQPASLSLEALERPSLEEPPEDGLGYWVGLDFGEVPEEEEPDTELQTPETPENAEAARSAFRALLNLDAASSSESQPAPVDKQGGSGNGRSNSAPLKKRVYEYSDVGMSVSEIARELGLGKGEVRLILNLRKDRGE